jgi:hypothetical protein
MLTLLVILAFIAFAYGAPPKITAITSAVLMSSALAIQALTHAVSGNRPPFIEALKAIGLSFFFVLLALLFFASATLNTIGRVILTIEPMFAVVALFLAFSLGYSLSLRTTLAASALIAVVSTLFAALLIYAARTYLLG